MNRIFKYITLALLAVFSLMGCHERYVTYSGAEYVMFADTMAIYPVQDPSIIYYYEDETPVYGQQTFNIPVVSTVARDYDRTFAVEIIDKGSNAIEKKHYSLESNTITIKAGELRADVVVRGNYENIEDTDSLGFELQLVMNDKLVMPNYGKNTKAVLMKSCPFDINEFTGYCIFTSMFLYQYSATGEYQRLIRTEKHPLKKNTVICRNWLADGYDVELTFSSKDPMKPFVTIDKGQVASDEGSIFGQTHGDNRILVTHSQLSESVYYPCGQYLYLWAHFYVENLGTPVGTVGHFYNVMEWISDEEAERIQKIEGM